MHDPSLSIGSLLESYRSRRASPTEIIDRLLALGSDGDPHHVWITRLSKEQLSGYLERLAAHRPDELPLYGIPFAIKDNIDLAGITTTAGCPAYAYVPARSATIVEKLIAAGAIPLGKTNLDQFATGLVGARSPYGPCANSVAADYISGGSSSGSAVAVNCGLVSFSLGTDTAGSGRVPAAFNNLVGLKPSLGRLSTRGVVPACRSLDCPSIFAATAPDAQRVYEVIAGFDACDPYSRRLGDSPLRGRRFGVPRPGQLKFFGDTEYARLFAAAVQRFETLGWRAVEIDYAPFAAAARLLYEGPWLAERYAAVGRFIDAHPQDVLPVTAQIIRGGKAATAVEAYEFQYRLKELQRESEAAWSHVDVLMTPTAGTIYTLAAVQADPIGLNSNLGYYTNFVNLFDLTGVAVPAGCRGDGLPFGVTLVGPAASEQALLTLSSSLHRALLPDDSALGAQISAAAPHPGIAPGQIALAVCGAHMQGLPLNGQLRERGAYFLKRTQTAASYRLYALPGKPPQRPGLIRVAANGAAIEVEVWGMPAECVGSLLAQIPAPLGLGTVELADGERVAGFLCEGYAVAGAADISAFGGWRAYLA